VYTLSGPPSLLRRTTTRSRTKEETDEDEVAGERGGDAVGRAVVDLCVGGGALRAVALDQGRRSERAQGVEKVAPAYPEEARAEKVQGEVVLDLAVDTDGAVSEVNVVKDPDARLSEAAAAAAGQWKFEPARTSEGKPVAVLYTVTIAFKLQ
jgi:TonB family protein